MDRIPSLIRDYGALGKFGGFSNNIGVYDFK